MIERLHIQVLGELDVQPAVLLPERFGRKAQALMVYLAVEKKNQPVDKLLTLLWNGDTNRRNRLDNELTYVRKLFVEGSLPIRDGIVQWNVPTDSFTLDIAQFEFEERQASREGLETAVRLYRGDFWADCTLNGHGPEFDDWLLTQRQRWQERFLLILEKLCLNAPQQVLKAHDHLHRLLRLDPTHEQANLLYLRYLLQNGRLNTALQSYYRYERQLQEEFGIRPTFPMQRMYQRISAAREGGAAPFLPPLASIIGRSEELQHVVERLAQLDCRLLTLVGPGGIGKTRLAQEAAAQIQHLFLDGVCFVDVTAVSPSQLGYFLADALHISLHGQQQPEEVLLKHLQFDERLLVLDSFENLLPEGCQLVHRLLSAAPGLKCLVTSRERLNLAGEWVLPLIGLSLPVMDDAVEKRNLSAAVQLFWQRARQSQPQFSPSLSEQKSIWQICSLSEGMPLAIELSAYWVRFHSCHEILKILEGDSAALTRAGVDLPLRHWSMKVTFDHSWNNLSEKEQKAFACLAIFPSTISMEAAMVIAAVDKMEIISLVNKSMLIEVKSGHYRLHPLLRNYGMERLVSMPTLHESAQNRLITYYAAFLKERDLARPTDQKKHLHEIAAEWETIQLAWDTAVRLQDYHFLPNLLHGVWSYYEFSGLFLLGYEKLSFALNLLHREEYHEEAMQLVVGMLFARRSWLAFRLGYFVDGVQDAEKGSKLLAPIAMPKAQMEYGRALTFCGLLYWYLGYYQAANRLSEPAQKICKFHDDGFGFGNSLLFLGFIAQSCGQYDDAFNFYLQIFELGRNISDQRMITIACAKISMLLLLMGKQPLAESYLAQAYANRIKIEEDPFGAALIFVAQANIDLQKCDFEQSEQHGYRALQLCQKIGERWFALICYLHLGETCRQKNDFSAAFGHFEKVVEEAQIMVVAPVLLAGCTGLLLTDWTRTKFLSADSRQLLLAVAQHPALEEAVRVQLREVLGTAVLDTHNLVDRDTTAVRQKVSTALNALAQTFHEDS